MFPIQQLSSHFTKDCFSPDSTREPTSTVEHYPIPSGEDLARSPQSSEGPLKSFFYSPPSGAFTKPLLLSIKGRA